MERSNYLNRKWELMTIITQSSFALDDIKLYLDTHPCDVEAIMSYKEYKKIREIAMDEYKKNYGPISAYDVCIDNYWDWINSPWPWEGVC
jgi:spore coat protein JB